MPARRQHGGHAIARLESTPLHPSLGAEVAGVYLGRLVDEPIRALSRALVEHLAPVSHDQSLTPAQHLAAAVVFGLRRAQH